MNSKATKDKVNDKGNFNCFCILQLVFRNNGKLNFDNKVYFSINSAFHWVFISREINQIIIYNQAVFFNLAVDYLSHLMREN